jgi:uncharacterized protein YbbC (DUF1343 family)
MRPLEVGVRLLATVRELHPDRFAWRADAYEFVADVPAIDLLTGSAAARLAIEGRAALSDVLASWDAHCRVFAEARRPFLLYS